MRNYSGYSKICAELLKPNSRIPSSLSAILLLTSSRTHSFLLLSKYFSPDLSYPTMFFGQYQFTVKCKQYVANIPILMEIALPEDQIVFRFL